MVNKIELVSVEQITVNEVKGFRVSFSDSNSTTSNQIKFYEIYRRVNGGKFEYLDRVFTTDKTSTKVSIKDENIDNLYYITFYDYNIEIGNSYNYRVRTVVQDLYVGIYDLIKNFSENTDVDYVVNPVFLENFVKQYLSDDLVSAFLAVENEQKDLRELVKKSKKLFSMKGLKESYYFFGRLLLKMFLIKHVIRNNSFDDGDFIIYDDNGNRITDYVQMLNSNIMSTNTIDVIDYSDFDRVEEAYLNEKLFILIHDYLDSDFEISAISDTYTNVLDTNTYASVNLDITSKATVPLVMVGKFETGVLTFTVTNGGTVTFEDETTFAFTEPTVYLKTIDFPTLISGDVVTVTYPNSCILNLITTSQKSIASYINLLSYFSSNDDYTMRLNYLNNTITGVTQSEDVDVLTTNMLASNYKEDFIKSYEKVSRSYIPQFKEVQGNLKNEFCYMLVVTGYIPAEEKANFYKILLNLLHPAGFKVTYQNVLNYEDYFFDRNDTLSPYDVFYDEKLSITKSTRMFDSFDFLQRNWLIYGEQVYDGEIIPEYPTLTETRYFMEGEKVQYNGSFYKAKYGFYTADAFNSEDWRQIFVLENNFVYGSETRESYSFEKTDSGKTNGACGTAHAKTYAYGTTTFGADTFCVTGTTTPTPDFPAQGDISVWECVGTGFTVGCYATRELPLDGICGTADRIFDLDETEYGLYTFCSQGTESVTPAFPTNGEYIYWNCVGGTGGTTASCSSTRARLPVNGECGTASRALIDEESFEGYTFCKYGTVDVIPEFPESGTVTWNCIGAYGGTTSECSATNS